MEITLEKIELVKDRTGVSYKEAKEALEAADGNVVDAIIAIEETIDEDKGSKAGDFVNDTMDKVKELVKKGNITKISIKKDDDTIINIPVTVGLVGVLLAPYGVVAAAIAAFGFKCVIELTTDEGKVINISDKAGSLASNVVEKGQVVLDEVVAKGSDVVKGVKEKAPEIIKDVKDKSVGLYNNVKDTATEKYYEYKAKKDGAENAFENVESDVEAKVETEDGSEAAEAVKSGMDKMAEMSDEAAEKVEKAVDDLGDHLKETAEAIGERIDDFWDDEKK